MAEHLSVGPEGKFVDRTVASFGVEESGEFHCEWKLRALPEYLESDKDLSNGVVKEIILYLKTNNLNDITVDLVEGYDKEDLGKEHYRLKMIFGSGSDNEKLTLSKHYSANTEDGEIIQGSVKLKVGLSSDSIEDHEKVENGVAGIYIRRMEKIYTDWKNDWDGGGFIEISK